MSEKKKTRREGKRGRERREEEGRVEMRDLLSGYSVISYTLPLIIIHKSSCVACSATSTLVIMLCWLIGDFELEGL